MLFLALTLCVLISCSESKRGEFADDIAFLQEHVDVIMLRKGTAAIAVVPAYQGRVMSSAYDADYGPGFGWLNRPVIASGMLSEEEKKGKLQDHIYVFGGEERFWLGPEGGQYALFFEPGSRFEFSDWKTPAAIDTEAFKEVKQTEETVAFHHECTLTNYSGATFQMGIDRSIRILDDAEVTENLGYNLPEGLQYVAYESDNRLTNLGDSVWKSETGLPSIWLLGMFKPSPETLVVIPIKSGEDSLLGPQVNDNYFGKVPREHLSVKNDAVFFKADGKRRGKIGISALRTKGIAASYDAGRKVLTVITYNKQPAPHGFVNSAWEIQQTPYGGDVINAYNDGSPAPGEPPLGLFYELETSSPAAALKPGESIQHVQQTMHFYGKGKELNELTNELLGLDISQIQI